ncbi:helix-turn-helix domain-containing protein [Streptomyces buecherae]|uniref:helix-turn-helix domain-containing protein n=1 Tax=Streptomyces buecherae TaxID=2763006 RepID=UPI003664BA6C
MKQLRRAAGLKQHELAGESISAGYVSRLKSGMQAPSAETVKYLASRLGVPVSDLLREAEPEVNSEIGVQVAAGRNCPSLGDFTKLIEAMKLETSALSTATNGNVRGYCRLLTPGLVDDCGTMDTLVSIISCAFPHVAAATSRRCIDSLPSAELKTRWV